MGITKLPRFAEAREVTARTATCARLAQRLPSGAFKDDLRCLAPPALELAEHIPVLAQTVEVCVRQSLAAGVLLVPNLSTESSRTSLAWVTPQMVPHEEGVTGNTAGARQVTAAASDIGPAVRQSEQHLPATAPLWTTERNGQSPRRSNTPAVPAVSSAPSSASA